MTTPDTDAARLEINARMHRYDEHLEKAADLYDADPQEWLKLPVLLQDRSGVYRDTRAAYRRAVEAGAIQPDDRGGPPPAA